ncbi:MAG: polysaccharide deacetylase family protein [Alphaproteobacteria bacterium]|jgi:hypothetical protein|nr:polysaccharide deacetylase family protein [Alphaproteobacteria bacterium]
MSTWQALGQELQAWSDAGRRATFWWRDDDAERPTPALDRLLALARSARVAPALAVVPAGAGRELADALAEGEDVAVLCHGLGHRNHAPTDAKKAEFGPHRPVFEMLGEVAAGHERLKLLFTGRALPVFVPPWNRIDPELSRRLPLAGFAGVSAFGPRAAEHPVPGLVQVNCHFDLTDWRGDRGFVGESRALAALVEHLRARRGGAADGDEPTGVMSHHLVLDEAGWNFLGRLFEALEKCDGAHWLSPREAFNLAP